MGIERRGNTYRKTDSTQPSGVELEGLALQWLADPMVSGGAHVVPVLEVEPGILITRAIPSGRCTPAAAEWFGRALALTHAGGADYFGQAPPGWEHDGWMGRAVMSYAQPSNREWGEFYAEDRLLPNLGPCVDNRSISPGGARVIERVCEHLRDGDFNSAQPSRIESPAARIHGDLWNGNVLWAPTDTVDWAPSTAGHGTSEAPLPNTVGILIDPAACGGHAETDLATLGVFGQSHLDRIYAGYQSESPLDSGWQERIGLHQLYILIIHALLFGGGYGDETVSVAKKYA
ncbi:MAG: fructosamine kinase family protein [Actinomycetaceae bacterium]|nr:fructosamine kinase family protein [Actinomycetaceae bacterium]